MEKCYKKCIKPLDRYSRAERRRYRKAVENGADTFEFSDGVVLFMNRGKDNYQEDPKVWWSE